MVVVNFATIPYNPSLNPKVFIIKKSCLYTPEQNDIAERKHRHIVEIAIFLIFHSTVPLEFWPYVFSMVVFLIN